MFSDGKAMAAAASVSAAKPPIPRHDPTVDGSLVMPRPSHTHQAKWNARKRPLVDVVVDPLLCAHLREHQRQGVQFLYECVMGMKEFDGQGAILADEMGLGKTLQTIALLWTLLKQNPYHGDQPTVKRALVVCPTTLINNWKQEFKKWLGDERIRAFVVDSKANIGDFLHGKIYNVMIIGYEKLRTVQELLSDAQFDIVVCFPGHRLKSQNIKTAQAIRTLLTKRRIILSGTPIQNDLGEFFAMVNFINPALFDSYTSFKKVFEEPIVRSRQPDCSPADVDLGKARADELTRLTNMFILRRTSQVIAKYLPPKIELVLFCRPSPLQRDLYDCFLGTPALRCLTTAAASEHLSCITALKKLCNSPSLTFDSATKAIDEGVGSSLIYAESRCLDAFPPGFDSKKYDPVISGKLMVLDHILTELRASTKEKVVLVSNYTQTLDILEGMCNKHEYDFFRLDGSTPSGKRQEYVDRFNSPTCNKFVFLLSSKSGGVGLNLIGASRLILFDVD
ncbi:hypothetical protein BC937DRAFT_88569 [Endogone sp. FLAS-F59071]|nr:hypothetical protein BC937DRAFT_88569 [Endogone sp. FLAS-F59071]RUS22540.1 hypothetical protein BC937DRAFT_88569 [Endogone sp. FLAS-F59071]|eukprot:RUS22539.1 hypothetical protein BC937DRAFT_88569 [Endogone sp. FLAS-F59071]